MTEKLNLTKKSFFFNRTFDKGRLKNLISWYLTTFGEYQTIQLLEELKVLGFHNATQAGISLSIDDLLIPDSKTELLRDAEIKIQKNSQSYNRGDLTSIERFQYIIDTWHSTSENMKTEVVQHFRSTNMLNPVYMMAFSGARGNLSQVRQLVGMRGLMSDPQGEIINFPISSNFREGLTLTEYVISCYGARKGIVDTALRTANSGYLTRRLVDVAQHILISSLDCGTIDGISIVALKDGRKTLLSLKDRLIGRVLAENVETLATRNQIIDKKLASQIEEKYDSVLVRSPLTCNGRDSICQLCYGWSLAHNQMVSLGEAVGIIAAQSIGEPGTQLTMRTFHTGGVFSGDALDQITAPISGQLFFDEPYIGELIRTTHGKIAFFIKTPGKCKIYQQTTKQTHVINIPEFSILFIQNGEFVNQNDIIAEFASIPTQNNQRVQSKQSLISPFDGQIFFEDVVLSFMESKTLDSIKTAREFGSLWVLKANIKEAKIKNSLFPLNGDFIHESAPIAEYDLVSSITGEIYLDNFKQNKFQNSFEIPKSKQSQFKNGLTTKKIRLPFSNLRWQSKRYSSLLTLKNSNFFESVFIKCILNTGFAENDKQFFNVNPSLFGICLENLQNAQYQAYSQNLQAGFIDIQFNELFRIRKNFDVMNGLLSQKFPFSAKNRLFPTTLSRRPKSKNLLTTKTIGQIDSEKINLKVFSILQEWVPQDCQIIANYNRQGQIQIQKTPFAGFINLYSIKLENTSNSLTFENQQSQTVPSPNKTLFDTKISKVENFDNENNKSNLLFSIEKCWPYCSKNVNILNLNTKLESYYNTGEICIDDITFESKRVLLQIKQKTDWQLHPNWILGSKSDDEYFDFLNNNDENNKVNSSFNFDTVKLDTETTTLKFKFPTDITSNLTDNLTKLSIHLAHYPNSKTLWSKLNTNHQTNSLSRNSFFAISPLLNSYTFKKQKTFNKKLALNFKNKNHWKIQSKKQIAKQLNNYANCIFNTKFLTVFNEFIPNQQIIFNVPIQNQLIGIEYSFDSFLNIYKKLYGSTYYIPYFLNQFVKSNDQKNVTFKSSSLISEKQWNQSSLTYITLNVFDLFAFNIPSNSLVNKTNNLSQRKNQYVLQKNKTNQVVLDKLHNTYISKDEIIGKRQTLNISSGEVIIVPKINMLENTTDLNYQDAQKSSQLFFISKDHLVSYDVTDEYKNFEKTNTIKLLGNLVRLEQTLWDKKSIPEAGQIISIRKIDNKIILILRKGQPFLFSSRAVFHVFHNDSVLKDNLLLTLFYRRLQTGDIVQGIPKIEEFFEARSSKFGEPLENSVPVKLKTLYENLTRRLPLQKAVRQSVQLIQKYLVDNVQQVYQSQGVTLADKHLEIIVRQMTSKVKIIDGGQTGFLPGELVNLDTIELINQGMEGSRATYEPILLGITKASLETKSFISAASFQETTRILARAAIEKKTDFLKGLKENVILGHVIPAGTGFKEFLALKNINEISD